MRLVTRKPPNTLTAASATASVPKNLPVVPTVSAAASIAPTITIAEIAFVTAISGVCSAGVLDVEHGQTIGLVVETQCNYFAPLVFPQQVDAGLRVVRLGTSSVRYEVGLFAQGDASPAAQGHFVHVYVDRGTRRPVPLPDALRAALDPLSV